jgi:hypothetical protein
VSQIVKKACVLHAIRDLGAILIQIVPLDLSALVAIFRLNTGPVCVLLYLTSLIAISKTAFFMPIAGTVFDNAFDEMVFDALFATTPLLSVLCR